MDESIAGLLNNYTFYWPYAYKFGEIMDDSIPPVVRQQMLFVMNKCDSFATDKERASYLFQTVCVLLMNEAMNIENHVGWKPSNIDKER